MPRVPRSRVNWVYEKDQTRSGLGGIQVKKSEKEIMEILEAYDLTGCAHSAAQLVGCDPKTVVRYVAQRECGSNPYGPPKRSSLIEPYLEKIEELVERSEGKIRADVTHRKLTSMGFTGSQRTTRRAVAECKERHQEGTARVYRPWVPEPGMWLQWDYGEGPRIGQRRTHLFCSWLAWSRYRVVIPLWEKSLPSVIGALDATFRKLGGVPSYALTDNEKTVTTTHVAGVPVRNPEMVAAARHYGVTVASCVPADPQSKGGSEATVRIAKADLLPTEANLRPDYESFSELKEACEQWGEEVNERPHRETNKPPAMMLARERGHLHPVPEEPFTAAFGQTRRVGWDSTVSFGGTRYSVPHTLVDKKVWVREAGEEVVMVDADPSRGSTEVARHPVCSAGNPSIFDEHYPPAPAGALHRQPRPKSPEEVAFMAIGEGARLWLLGAAAAGTRKLRSKMEHAIQLSKLYGKEVVNEALSVAAGSERFGEEDLLSILAYRYSRPEPNGHREEQDTETVLRRADTHTLQQGTASWRSFGG